MSDTNGYAPPPPRRVFTHAGLLSGPRAAGIEPSACSGFLIELGSYTDRHFVVDWRERVVTVFRCSLCEQRVSVSVASGLVLNCYRLPPARPEGGGS